MESFKISLGRGKADPSHEFPGYSASKFSSTVSFALVARFERWCEIIETECLIHVGSSGKWKSRDHGKNPVSRN